MAVLLRSESCGLDRGSWLGGWAGGALCGVGAGARALMRQAGSMGCPKAAALGPAAVHARGITA